MERAAWMAGIGVAVVGALAAAGRWAPEALRPAGARTELARLIMSAVGEFDAAVAEPVPNDAISRRLATGKELKAVEIAPTARCLIEPVPTPISVEPARVCLNLQPFEFKATGDQECRVSVVVFRSLDGVRAAPRSPDSKLLESKLLRRDLVNKG